MNSNKNIFNQTHPIENYQEDVNLKNIDDYEALKNDINANFDGVKVEKIWVEGSHKAGDMGARKFA